MLIYKKSILTGKINEYEVNITPEEYQEILEGEQIDLVNPELSQAEKTFLLTGITPSYEEDRE